MRRGQVCKIFSCGLLAILLGGCGAQSEREVVTLWHQMRPADRAILEARVDEYVRKVNDERAEDGGKELEVRVLYKENEELRSGMEMAVLVNSGPDIIYGPSDPLGVYNEIGALADMSAWFPAEDLADFDPDTLSTRQSDTGEQELIFVGDRFGNHLALVYNKNILKEPPKTAKEFAELGDQGQLKDLDGNVVPYVAAWNYTEPFFLVPFLTGHGAWVFAEDETTPTLDTQALIDGLQYVADLKSKKHFLPRSSDYNAANELFLAGKAAMIINGDWSWQQYINADGIDAAVTTLPVVEGKSPMASMVSPKGYSLSISAVKRNETQPTHLENVMALVKYLTDEGTQRRYLKEQFIVPSRLSLRDEPILRTNATLRASVQAANTGRLMPTQTEMRAVWDAMRPPYQSLMAGNITAEEAAAEMQRAAEEKIATLTTVAEPDAFAPVVPIIGLVALAALLFWQRRALADFWHDLSRNRIAYYFALPSLLGIFVVVLFPLVFNVALSFSNMSLRNFNEWEIVGLHNYVSLFVGENAENFWMIFFKTIFWTAINVFFHVTLGVLLAVVVNGPVRGKSIYRLLLIIPWAVPAYITALTWRGMFDFEFGVVNQLVEAVNAYLPTMLQLPLLDWLNTPNPAFTACIIANVWLGFPFMMVIALGGLQGIPQELYEAARIDRANRWQQFWSITVPMLKPVMLPAITLGAIWTFNNLNVVWLVSNRGEPADQTHILVSYVYRAAFNLYQYGYGAALSMVIFLILLVFSMLFLQRTGATEGVT